MGVHAHLVYSHTGYDVISNFWSAFLEKFEENIRKCHLLWLSVWFKWLAFCLPHQLVGFEIIDFKLPQTFVQSGISIL